MKVRVEYTLDETDNSWVVHVPAVSAVGTGETRKDAERQAVGLIAYALEGVESEFDNDVTEVAYVDVDVQPGWPPSHPQMPKVVEPSTGNRSPRT